MVAMTDCVSDDEALAPVEAESPEPRAIFWLLQGATGGSVLRQHQKR